MPITWKNVNGGGFNEAVGLMRGASDNINKGFSAIGDAILGVQKDRQRVWDQGVETNTDTYLDQLASFANPAALEQAQADGSLDKLRASFGDQVDPDVLRGADDERLKTLRQEVIASDEFDLNRANKALQPVLDNVSKLMATGKYDDAAKIVENESDLFRAANKLGDTVLNIETGRREKKARDIAEQDRLRAVREREANTWFKERKSQIARSVSDPIEALGILSDEISTKGFDDLLGQRAVEIRNEMADYYGLSGEQVEEWEGYASSVRANVESDIAYRQGDLDRMESDFNHLTLFDASPRPDRGVTSAIEWAGANGWDKTNWAPKGLNLADEINQTYREALPEMDKAYQQQLLQKAESIEDKDAREAAVKEALKAKIDRGVVQSLLHEAVVRSGDGSPGWGKKNIRREALISRMKEAYSEYAQREVLRAQLEEKRRTVNADIETLRGNAATSIAQYKDRLQSNNKSKLLRIQGG